MSKKDDAGRKYRITGSDGEALFRPTLHSATMLVINMLREDTPRSWIHIEINEVVEAANDETPEEPDAA